MMKKIIVYCLLLIVNCFLWFIVAPSVFAHNPPPVALGTPCDPPDHTSAPYPPDPDLQLCIHPSGGGGAGGVGTITPPGSIPTAGSNPSNFVASLISNGILLLLIISGIAAFIYIMLAGLKFITSQGDPKAIESAQSQIIWGVIGLAVILSAYAIIIVVEIFFRITIISGPFALPRIPTP